MIDRLELLLALAREKHFGRAAEACGISQPTFSSSVKALEDQLGVRIVERGSRFGGFTAEGERVLGWARRIVADARAMKQELAAAKHRLTGHLRIGVIPTALPFVPELTLQFTSRYGEVSLSVVSATSDAILAGLDNLELDVGISYIDTEPLKRFSTVPLYEERYALLVAPERPEARRDRVAWTEAGQLALCLLTPDMQNRRIIDRHLAEAGSSRGPSFESNSMTMLHVHVRTGRWATIAALGVGERFDPPLGLKAVPVVEPTVTHKIGLIVTSREPQPRVVAAFLSCVRRQTRSPGTSAAEDATSVEL